MYEYLFKTIPFYIYFNINLFFKIIFIIIFLKQKKYNEKITVNNGYLGSYNDEERSEM